MLEEGGSFNLLRQIGSYFRRHGSAFGLLSVLFVFIGGVILSHLVVRSKGKPPPEFIKAEPEGLSLPEEKGKTEIVVDIAGSVQSPGVYEVPSDSRLQDLIEAAGGLSETVDELYLAREVNLAQKLFDSQKVYICSKDDVNRDYCSEASGGSSRGFITTGPSAGTGKQVTRINLNKATVDQIESLEGIGPVYAQRIIEGRPYQEVDQLLEVRGIGPKTLEKIREFVTVK